MRTDRIRPPAQDSRKRTDEEGVVKRHVNDEAVTRKTKDDALVVEDTALGAKDVVLDTRITNTQGTNTNQTTLIQVLNADITRIDGLIGTVEPNVGMRGDIATLFGLVGRTVTADGLRKDMKAAEADIRNLQDGHGNQATGISEAKADAKAVDNRVDALLKRVQDLEAFQSRPAKFAAAANFDRARAHDH